MNRWLSMVVLMLCACKQGPATSGALEAEGQALPGPEVFEGGPEAKCRVDDLVLTITFGPEGDYKWARLSDAPVADGNPRVEYLQSDSSRIRKTKDGKLASGRWQRAIAGQDSIEAKVYLDAGPGECQVSGYVLNPEQKRTR